MTRSEDELHMRRALDLARRGWGQVTPNPMVGAVVVRDGEVVGEGYHGQWGGPHAEVVALKAAGAKAEGATLYVTLEPCHHAGKTDPCTREIVKAGIARIVWATGEINPLARGGGEWLRSQGLQAEEGVCELAARDLNAVHLNAFLRERPFVALKYAVSIDARLSEAPGESTTLTSGEAVSEAHRLRAGHEAVMVGIGTVLVDDPQLTVREWATPRVTPARVVLDSNLRLPLGSRLVQSAGEVPVWVFTAEDAASEAAAGLEARGVEVLRVPRLSPTGDLDLGAVLATLWKRGAGSVLCEGGAALGAALLAAGLVDRLYVFIAPLLFGEPGVAGFPGMRGQAPREWRLIERRELGAVTLLAFSAEAAEA